MSLTRKNSPQSNYNPYKSNEISTVSQSKLIIMLYEGAIRFLNTASDNMQPRNYEIAHNNIMKAQDIVTELMMALNIDEGGEIGNNLLGIYVYIKKRLLEANMEKDGKILEEAIKLLSELKDAWEEIEKKEKNSEFARPKNDPLLQRGSSFSIQG